MLALSALQKTGIFGASIKCPECLAKDLRFLVSALNAQSTLQMTWDLHGHPLCACSWLMTLGDC